jgi:iron complex outermembrane receptor protein
MKFADVPVGQVDAIVHSRVMPTLLALLSSVCPIAAGAQAQATPARPETAASEPGSQGRGEDIVVTATRRGERLIDVPLSIQAIDGAELVRSGAVNFADYARAVAGVSFIDAGPGRAQIFIRGVSTGEDVDTGKEATVGVYIDETPVTEGSSQPDLKLYDIDRIEVLRGPQGTLYGSGSLGGTVRILTNQPDFTDARGYVQLLGSVTRSGDANGSINGWVNVPLSDKVAVRTVGYGLHNSGFLDNGFNGAKNINQEDTYGGRLAVRVRPSDALNVVLTGYYQDTSIGAYNRVTDHYPDLVIDQSAPEPFKDRYGIINLKIDLDLGFANLTSSSSYFDRRRRLENDIDYFLEAGFGIPRGFSPLVYDAKSKSQELRLASSGATSFKWLVGAFYLHRDETFHQTINILGAPPPATQADNLYFERTQTGTEQIAGFAEVSYELLPSLTATAGVRVSRTARNVTATRDGLALGGLDVVSGSFRSTSTTPKFNLSYKPTGDSLIYAQAAKGFRVGGVNPGLPPCGVGCTVDVGSTFNSDSLWNYELGAKFQAFHRALSVTAAAFYIDWSNIQLNVSRGDGFNGFLNAGDARTRGFEVEAHGRLGEHLRLGGQLTYTDAKLRRLATAVAAIAAPGARLPDIARWNAAANAEWRTPVGGGYAYVRGDLQYVGNRRSELAPTALPLGAYTLFNFRVGLDAGPYQVALFANNVTDERAQLSRSMISGVRDGAPITFDRYTVNVPRTIGISVARTF